MGPIHLAPAERQSLQNLLGSTHDVRAFRRAQALLWMGDGMSVREAAAHQHVSNQAVYGWIHRFKSRPLQDTSRRVADAPRSGRPATIKGVVEPILESVIDKDPRSFGYSHTTWTADLLVHFLAERHSISASDDSVRQALHRKGIVWKAPRYRLRRRPPNWRQKKGA